MCKKCAIISANAWRAANSERVKNNDKKYRAKNTDDIKKYKNNYYLLNREILSLKCKEYRDLNKDKIKNIKIKWHNANYNSNPQYTIERKLRHRLYMAIKKLYKSGSSVLDLGCTVPVLLVYLNLDCIYKYGIPYTRNEHLFHIDHIIPLSSFDLTDRNQLLKAVNWSNLQILTIRENLMKGDKAV
jgi:hypothetical protein